MQVLIDTGHGYVDYTQFVVDGSITTEDSINVPTLLNFILSANQDNNFLVPKRSSYVRVVSEIYSDGPGFLRQSLAVGATNFVVQGTAEPWNSNDPTYPFNDTGAFNPGTAPTSVPVVPGTKYVLTYQSGGIFLHVGFGPYDANGSGAANVQSPAATYLPNQNSGGSLIGGFADANGHLVAPPFYIGNGPTSVITPAGATQLLCGVNDFPWGDNSGSWTIQISISNNQKVWATGFITNEIEREYLGLNPHLANYGNQQLAYKVNVSSDEWLLNSRTVPYIPAFIGQTQGQILAQLANILAPRFFDVTSQVASGDIVPFFQYDPTKTWSDVAKEFADSARYRYKVLDRVVYYQPFGDQPLGVAYDETQVNRNFFPLEMQTRVLTVPPVNDAIVIGAVEPQTNWENYFVGDGITSQFRLLHKVFDGATALLLQDDWTEGSFQTNLWTITDPLGQFQLAGALNVISGSATGLLNTSFILSTQGVELGGGLNFTHGEFAFQDYCEGIVGGIYATTALTQANCIAGFSLTTLWPRGHPTPGAITASGASGIIIQPMYNGQLVGPKVISQVNHHYVLQTYIGAQAWSRYDRIYRNLTGSVAYGGNALTASGTITFVVTDYDEGLYAITTPQPFAAQQIIPQVTRYSVTGALLPEFAAYALINNVTLNLTVNYTTVSQPPEGSLFVRSLTGATGLQLPILPQNIGPEIHYLMGFGLQGQTATVSSQNDTQYLAFYDDTIPAVGGRIRYQSWAAGQSVSRVINQVSVAQEAVVTGDSGVRSAIFTNLNPAPRTSDECEAAAGAAILDRELPQFQGSYTVQTVPRKFETLYNPGLYDYPRTGRFLYINSSVRAVTGQNFATTTIRMSCLDLREETLQIETDYGPDLYLEKLLAKFTDRMDNVLTPQETANPPNPIFLSQVGNAFLPVMNAARIISITNNAVTGNFVTIDLGVVPVTACEIRRVDNGFGQNDANRVALVVGQRQVTLPRTSRDQTWYVRAINGAAVSRFSKALRVLYPLVPSSPTIISVNAETAVFDFAGDTRDIYGLEVRANPVSGAVFLQFPNFPEDTITQFTRVGILVPTDAAAGGMAVKINSNAAAYYNPASNASTFPFPMQFQTGDIVFVNSPSDASFGNVHIISNQFTASGSIGPTPITSSKLTFTGLEAFFFNALSGTKGSYFHPNPLGSIYSQLVTTGTPGSLLFNYPLPNNRVFPMRNIIFDSSGNNLGSVVLWSGMNQNWDMSITGNFIVPAPGQYTFNVVHDDGFYIGFGPGATLVSGPIVDIGPGNLTTTVLGLNTMAGYNGSGDRTHQIVVNFASAGSIQFELAYDNWESAEHLFVTVNGYDILPAPLSSPVSGAPWGVGWFDYKQPYPVQVGQNIMYGVNSQVGTMQMYSRGPYSVINTAAVSGGYTGLTTMVTQTPHGFTAGQQIIIGAGWQTFPVSGYGPMPNTGSVFCGVQIVTNVINATTFQFVSAILSQNPNPIPGSWEDNLANFGVSAQTMNGVVAAMPTPFTLNSTTGVLVQRPVFAPSDLVVDFTNADVAEVLGILQQLSTNGRVQGLNAYFFNLTWDYSLPTSIPSFEVPAVTGIFIDNNTQIVSWNLSSGKPTGYRVLVQDPITAQVVNKYTIDHPHNPTLLTQFQMTPTDFASNRLVTVTPFDVVGDGVPITVYHPGASAGGGNTAGAVFTECIDVRAFGAVGDGVTDDTVAIQTALSEAEVNAAGGRPAVSETIVCIPSSLTCLVTPQFVDGSTSGAAGFGPTAVALKIGSGVTLRVDGELILGAPTVSGFPTQPWVVLENASAYNLFGPGDIEVTIEGTGAIECNGLTLGHNTGAVKLFSASGCRVHGVEISGDTLYGVALGNVSEVFVNDNIFDVNSVSSVVKVPGSRLDTVAIYDNIAGAFPAYTNLSSPIYPDGISTVFMHNPATDPIIYRSMLLQNPTIEGNLGGSGGFVHPETPPNCFYSVTASGGSNVLQQSGTSSSITVNAFTIVWPDKTVSYAGPSGGLLSTTHGITTYHVFVDDPYRDGNTATIKYGVTTQIRDLTSSAGRYYLGTVIMTASGNVAGTTGGMIPPGTISVAVTAASGGGGGASGANVYDIGCTLIGLVPASGYITIVPMVRQVMFASGFSPSQAWCRVTASGTVVLSINKIPAGVLANSALVGTITYTTGQPFATFSGGPVTYSVKDVLTVVGPNSIDATLADIGYVISGTR